MPSKRLVLLLLVCCAAARPAEISFKLTGTAEADRTAPNAVYVDYTGSLAPGPNPFLTPSSWKVFWSVKSNPAIHAANVASVEPDAASQKIRLLLDGDVPPAGASWSVLFNPAGPPYVLPQVIAGTPTREEAAPEPQAGAPAGPVAHVPAKTKKSCDSTDAKQKPMFCPAASGQPPDVTLTASFLAAGGTKPIYTLVLKGTLQGNGTFLGFHPGVSTDFEINQNLKPPVNSTTFDPDSITAGLSFVRVIPMLYSPPPQGQPAHDHLLYGVKLQLGVPNFEFSTSDPSSSIIFNPAATFVLTSWQPTKHSYVTFYPFLALETGENLSKPAKIEKIPVNLSSYNAILRGVLGTDAALVTVSPDDKGKGGMVNTFSLTGSYRVRLPAFDEPEVRTLHQVTTVDLTTKARHWVEGDINFAPWSFKYLAITGKYQYGELPPLFKLLDHSFTIGLTLQASQSK